MTIFGQDQIDTSTHDFIADQIATSKLSTELEQAFKALDANDSGQISKKEINTVLVEHGQNLSEA